MPDEPLRCPVPSPDGLPCQKTIPAGWAVEDGHAGGHWWASDKTNDIIAAGHFDAAALLSGEPVKHHTLADCPGWPNCFGEGAPGTPVKKVWADRPQGWGKGAIAATVADGQAPNG